MAPRAGAPTAGDLDRPGQGAARGDLAANGARRHHAAHEPEAPRRVPAVVDRSRSRRGRLVQSAAPFRAAALRTAGHHRPGAADRLANFANLLLARGAARTREIAL